MGKSDVIGAHLRWLRERLKREGRSRALAALTGQDSAALRVFVAALELYVTTDDRPLAIGVMRGAVMSMQTSCRFAARMVIPAGLDWGDEFRLWRELVQGNDEVHVCKLLAETGYCEICGETIGNAHPDDFERIER